MNLPTIGTLWIGGELSWLEQLCLKSFLDNGHRVVLFSYEKVTGVPDGVEMADANDILPTDRIIRHAKSGSPAFHADYFRLNMLRDTDYIWADTDAYCCQPWTVRNGHFHGWISDNKPMVNNGVLRLPQSSKTLAALLDFASDEFPVPPWFSEEKQAELRMLKERGEGVHISLLPWGVSGPGALTHYLNETGEIEHALPGHMIYPVPFKNAGVTLHPKRVEQARKLIKDDTLSIHFWGRRFRNIAAKYDGGAAEGSYVHELLEKHGIDQEKTRHLLRQDVAQADFTDPAELNFSMFDDQDIFNMVLQRSEIGRVGAQIQAYLDGDDGPLMAYARDHRDLILHECYRIAERELGFFLQAVDDIHPKRVVDIGCGYAFADLVLHRRYGSSIVLVDIEASEDRHFGFESDGAGYTSLEKARVFLEKNGVPPEEIKTVNPNTTDVAGIGEFDFAISLASCGFHYPVSTYDSLFRNQIAPGGAIALDIRKRSGGIGAMKQFGEVEVLKKHGKYSSVLARVAKAQ